MAKFLVACGVLVSLAAAISVTNTSSSKPGRHERAVNLTSGKAETARRRGRRGPRGRTGRRGPAGGFSPSNVVQANGPSVTMGPDQSINAVQGSLAFCPAGSVVLGGGWDGENSPPVNATVGYNHPIGTSSWSVIMVNRASISSTFHAVATCAVPSARAARKASSRPSSAVRRQVAHEVDALRSAALRKQEPGSKRRAR